MNITPTANCIRFMMLTLSDDMDRLDKYNSCIQLRTHGLYYHLKNYNPMYGLNNIFIIPKTIYNAWLDEDTAVIENYTGSFLDCYYDLKEIIYNDWKKNILSNREKEAFININLYLPNELISQIIEYV